MKYNLEVKKIMFTLIHGVDVTDLKIDNGIKTYTRRRQLHKYR